MYFPNTACIFWPCYCLGFNFIFKNGLHFVKTFFASKLYKSSIQNYVKTALFPVENKINNFIEDTTNQLPSAMTLHLSDESPILTYLMHNENAPTSIRNVPFENTDVLRTPKSKKCLKIMATARSSTF